MKYPIYKPYLEGNIKTYVNKCIDSTWISSKGEFITQFEKGIADYCNIKYATSVFNGTVALHLALASLEIGKGDEVIVPDFTYIATANAVKYVGATPVFTDVESTDWNISLDNIKRVYNKNVKAIIVVDIYGTQPKELREISEFAKENGVFLIQDSAESLGSKHYGFNIGHYADLTTLSFFGNKTITTGEGGMVLTNNKELYEKMNILKNQGNSKEVRYFHDILGFNFRMTNIQAAIGTSQLELIDEILDKKRKIIDMYKKYIGDIVEFQKVDNYSISSNWLVSIIPKTDKNVLIEKLENAGVETRPFFQQISSMPFYKKVENKNTIFLSKAGISLPSYPELEEEDIKYICSIIRECGGLKSE